MSECGNCELCTFTVERFEVYYFDSYATDGFRVAWEDDPEHMVDNLLTTFASTNIENRIQWLDENTATLQTDKTITKIEIRAFSTTGSPAGMAGPINQYLRPVFVAGQGDNHVFEPPQGPDAGGDAVANWSEWFDITSDTNAPGTWTWADVVALDMDIWSIKTAPSGDPQILRCAKVEIRVTWNESVQMYFPRTIDGGLSKNIDIFNLWKVTVKTRDSGLNTQPYRFSGIMMPICGVASDVVLCFPICFPLCFEEGGDAVDMITAPTVFKTIHEWIENHDKVTISCYGQCADGKYIIKQFGTHSMRSPDYYGYNLILEKVSD